MLHEVLGNIEAPYDVWKTVNRNLHCFDSFELSNEFHAFLKKMSL